MEQTAYTHFGTREAAEWDATRLGSLGWSVEVASEPDEDGWLVTARYSDGEEDGSWAVSRMKAWAD